MWGVKSRVGRSPTFKDPGTPLNGLTGTRQSDGVASGLELASLTWTHGYPSTRVPLPALVKCAAIATLAHGPGIYFTL